MKRKFRPQPMENKIILLGLDSVSLDIIRPWLKKGYLPNLNKLINEGASGDLNSTIPPVSPCAWTSAATGKNPGKHGIFDFERRTEDYSAGIVSSLDVREPRVWDITNKNKKTAGVFNYLCTYPPNKIKGYMVTGFLTPSAEVEYTYPKELSEDLASLGYRLKQKEKYLPGKEDEVFNDIISLIINKEKIILHLLDKHECDLNIFVIVELDYAHHRFWKFMDKNYPCSKDERRKHSDKILRLYQRVDQLIGRVLKKAKDKYIIIISDHGAGPLYNLFFVNKWLMKEGLLKMKSNFKTKIKILLAKYEVFMKIYKLIVKLQLRNIFLLFSLEKRRGLTSTFISLDDIDWSKTKAYSRGEFNQIYLNVKGREYERLRESIIKKLKALKYIDGNKLITEVYKKEDIYEGPYIKYAPDIVFVMRDNKIISSIHFGFETDSLFGGLEYINNTGTHRRKGMFIIAGKGIKKGYKISADIVDITPTILHLMNISCPGDMDGRILKEIFKSKSYVRTELKKARVRKKSSKEVFSAEDEKKIVERLKNLGYLS